MFWACALNGVIIFYMYKYWENNPDPAECWIAGGAAYPTMQAANAANQSLTAVDWAEQMRLWFQIGFFLYCLNLAGNLLGTIGKMLKSQCFMGLGGGVTCLSCLPMIIWVILGCVWRWGENGTIASCYSGNCANIFDEMGN